MSTCNRFDYIRDRIIETDQQHNKVLLILDNYWQRMNAADMTPERRAELEKLAMIDVLDAGFHIPSRIILDLATRAEAYAPDPDDPMVQFMRLDADKKIEDAQAIKDAFGLEVEAPK